MVSAYKQADWLHTTNIYEVNLRQYSAEGTFNAFAASLPRLNDMGVEVLWFMPIHPIGEVKRKGTLGSYYSIKDFKAVNPEFGTANDFKKLVQQAHELGMKVIMDWVANHAAWDNVWTNTHPDFFERDEAGNFKPPYDWDDVIQIHHANAEQQDAMIAAMKYWVSDFDIDGFRADLAHLTPLDFWKKARTAIEPMKKVLFWLAETEEINYHEVFDASFTWEWMHKTEEYCKDQTNREGLDKVLHRYYGSFPATAYRMYFTSNHDENSWNGTEYEKYGNRALALSVFSLTWNGIPLIYSGQELPNRRRLKFFDKDVIGWTGEFKLHTFYKTLLNLRKSNPAMRAGDAAVNTFLIALPDSEQVFAYLRKNAADEVLVFLNLSELAQRIVIGDTIVEGGFKEVFTGERQLLHADSIIEMQPGAYLVYEKEGQ